MGRRVGDLDARDYQARIEIRAQLRERRQALGVSQQKLGRLLGWEGANIRRLEREGVDQSYTVSVMRWARALGLRLVLEPVGFPPPAPSISDPLDDLLSAIAGEVQMGGDAGDGWEVSRLTSQLVGIRIACRVTQPQLARKFGTTSKNVSLIETAGSSTALVVLQRHARGIARCAWRPDAHLSVRLEGMPVV